MKLQLTTCVKKDIITVSFGCILWNFLDQFFLKHLWENASVPISPLRGFTSILTQNSILKSLASQVNYKKIYKKILHTPKEQKRFQRTKIRNMHKRHLRGKKLLICLFAFCAFAWLHLCAFRAFRAFSA